MVYGNRGSRFFSAIIPGLNGACFNGLFHHGPACKRLLRQCTPGTGNGNNTWDLVFCMTKKFVDPPAHRRGPQVVVHDRYTSPAPQSMVARATQMGIS